MRTGSRSELISGGNLESSFSKGDSSKGTTGFNSVKKVLSRGKKCEVKRS